MKRLAMGLMAVAVISTPAPADDYSSQWRRMESVFECAALAKYKPTEQIHLFKIGHDIAGRLLPTLDADSLGRISDLRAQLGDTLSSKTDFTLGFLWARALEIRNKAPSERIQEENWLGNEFGRRNCDLL